MFRDFEGFRPQYISMPISHSSGFRSAHCDHIAYAHAIGKEGKPNTSRSVSVDEPRIDADTARTGQTAGRGELMASANIRLESLAAILSMARSCESMRHSGREFRTENGAMAPAFLQSYERSRDLGYICIWSQNFGFGSRCLLAVPPPKAVHDIHGTGIFAMKKASIMATMHMIA
nr:hypothetical protein CFP56_72616 [Quercus suber]